MNTNPEFNEAGQRLESAHDILRTRRHPLNAICAPKVIAVIGATETTGSVGRTVFQNLGRGGFEGVVYPVNPKRSSVLCVKAYPSIGAVPEKVDLAVICTPAGGRASGHPRLRQGGRAGRRSSFQPGSRKSASWARSWNRRFCPRRKRGACGWWGPIALE